MSIECSNVVWNRNFSGSSRKMVAIKLADHADDEGRGIWPAVEKIAAKCDLSCRTVQRVLSDFVREGILRVVSEGGGGPGDTRRYDFNMAVVKSLPLAVAPPDSRDVKPENKGDTVSPLTETKGDTDGAKGDIDDIKGDTVSPEPSITTIEPSLERERANDDGEKVDAGKAGDRTFKRAFAAWPTFVSDSEPAAHKAWDSLATDERLQAVERQADYVTSVRTSGRSKFCTFGVYLAEKRWEKLAPKPAVVEAARQAAPFGKAWGAERLAQLLRPMRTLPGFTSLELRIIDSNPEKEPIFWADKRLKFGWPSVVAMHDRAMSHPPRGVVVAPDIVVHGEDFQQVAVGGAAWLAWKALFAGRGWPWVEPERQEWVWFPALPDAADLSDAVERALDAFRKRIEGYEHAA